MKITVEISFYPLNMDYEKLVIGFIQKMNTYPDIFIKTTAMSTYLVGDYHVVMSMLTVELEKLYERIPQSSTVIKIIPQELDIAGGYLTF